MTLIAAFAKVVRFVLVVPHTNTLRFSYQCMMSWMGQVQQPLDGPCGAAASLSSFPNYQEVRVDKRSL